MNILVSTDENYFFHTCVMLCSLFKLHRNEEFSVYVLLRNVSKEIADYIQKFISAKKHTCSIFNTQDIDDEIIGVKKYLPDILKSHHLTMSAYDRLLLAEILPVEVHKILYLDGDIIINRRIDAFYNNVTLTEDTAAIVVEGFSFKDSDYILLASDSENKVKELRTFSSDYRNKIGFKNEEKFFNSGVMLFNLDYLRNIHFTQAVRHFTQTHGFFSDADQTILNILLKDKVSYAPFMYNCRPSVYFGLRSPPARSFRSTVTGK